MARNIKIVDVLICDDVRHEADDKYSLIGVNPSMRISTDQLPTMLNQLCFVIRLMGIKDGDTLHFRIEAPDGLRTNPVQGASITPISDGQALFFVQASPVQLSHTGTHIIRLKIDDLVFKRTFEVIQPS